MQSTACKKVQFLNVVPPPQSSQAAAQFPFYMMRNQQAGTANNSCQFMLVNTGVQATQNATVRNGAYTNRQPSNWQTLAVPHPAGSSSQTAGGKSCHLQQTAVNTQSGNHCLPVTYVLQQTFPQNSSTQSPPKMMNSNTSYPQQDMSGYWKQAVPHPAGSSPQTAGGNSYHLQQTAVNTQSGNHCLPVTCVLQQTFPQNSSTQSPPKMRNSNASYPQQDVSGHWKQSVGVHGNPLQVMDRNMSDRHQRWDQFHNLTRVSYTTTATSPPGGVMRNNSVTANSSSSGQNSHISSTSQQSKRATSSVNSNSHSRDYETTPLLSKPHPALGSLQEFLKHQKIAEIEDYLRNSFTGGPDGRPPGNTNSPCKQKKFVSEVRKTNQNMEPATVAETYNYNASQPLHLNSGQSLPTTMHSVMTTQQSSVLNGSHVTATGAESVNRVANEVFPPKKVRSLSDTPQILQLLRGTTPQRNKNQSSVANNCERLEVLETTIQSSPGRTRAVAVVQPLSQESYQDASNQTSSTMISQSSEGTATDESSSNPEKIFSSPKNKEVGYLREGPYIYPENQSNQMKSSTSVVRHSAATNDGTLVSPSDSAGSRDLSSATSKVPVSQSDDKDKSEMEGVFELASVPTIPWTTVKLDTLIQYLEKVQMELKDSTECDTAFKLLKVFWGSDPKICALRLSYYAKVMTDVKQFCRKHVRTNSVILSQVMEGFENQLKSYRVLKDNEVYSELPYKSSWLNVNERLDDIDKEFDFPQCLKHRLHPLESDSQPDRVETDSSVVAQTVEKGSNKMLSSTELKQVNSSKEKQDSTIDATSTSPNKTDCVDSSDPYSFEIQVLPPEEAKVIFEQTQSELPKSGDTGNQAESVSNSSVEGKPRMVIDATSCDSEPENKSFCPIEEICCIARWQETIWGLKPVSSSKCRCNSTQSHDDVTDKTVDKEEMAVQKKSEITSDGEFHSATEAENQVKGGESFNCELMTLCWPEQRSELSHTIDFPEDDDTPHSHSDKDPKDLSQIGINSNLSSTILISDDGDHLSGSENEIPNQMPDLENDAEQAQVKLAESVPSSCSDEKETEPMSRSDTEIHSDPEVVCPQDQLKSTGDTQLCTSVSSDMELENLPSSESEVASLKSDLDENCGPAQLTSTNGAESPLEIALQTWSVEHVERKRKRQRCHDRFYPIFKKSKKCQSLVDADSPPALEGASKCGKVLAPATDSKPLASKVRTVELALFGSTPGDKRGLLGGGESCISSASAAVQKAPKVITLNLSPMKTKSSKSVLSWEYSVKRLYKKWKLGFPPTKIRHKGKLKPQKYSVRSLFEEGFEKAKTIHTGSTEESSVSSEMRICNIKTMPWAEDGLKCGEKKTANHTVALKQSADQERNEAEDGSHAVMPPLQKIVLKFSVLPNSFDFKDGSNKTKTTSDPVPDKPKPDLLRGNDKSRKRTSVSAGVWCPIPEKEPCPPPATKTDSVFHEFQKKYMEKMQSL